MISCLAATSTQQPWQRRLQLLMIETYRNGGNTSPRFSRRLCFSTESMPFQPMFQASFQSRRLSVSNRIRLAIFRYMPVPHVGLRSSSCKLVYQTVIVIRLHLVAEDVTDGRGILFDVTVERIDCRAPEGSFERQLVRPAVDPTADEGAERRVGPAQGSA